MKGKLLAGAFIFSVGLNFAQAIQVVKLSHKHNELVDRHRTLQLVYGRMLDQN